MRVEATCWSLLGQNLTRGIATIWTNPNGSQEKPFGEHGDAPLRNYVIQTSSNMPARKGVLIAIYPPRMNLAGEPVSPDLNFWAGGEILHRNAWRRSGNCEGIPRKHWPHNRYEIFLLFEGETLALCDPKMKVGFITIQCEQPVLKHAALIDIAEYIYQAGLLQKSYRGLDWAINNIEMLGETHNLNVGEQLRHLRQEQLKYSLRRA
jgi:hypothetical protein